jgi:hypothetical protein
MAQLSTKIKMYCDANGVSEVDFIKMLCCKTIVMAMVLTLRSGI